jgi:hypothetical protein
LREFALTSASGEHDADVRVRDIDAFVEHVRGDDPRVSSVAESIEDLAPFRRAGLVGDTGDEKAFCERPTESVDVDAEGVTE